MQQQYHISLSRTAPVRLHQIESLVATLKQYLRQVRAVPQACASVVWLSSLTRCWDGLLSASCPLHNAAVVSFQQ